MRKTALAAGLVSVAFASFFGWVASLEAAPQPVKFAFTRVRQLQCDEGAGEACPNDFYPKVEIDNQGLDDGKDRFCCAHDKDFTPDWVFSRDVDTGKSKINLHVELFDQDDLSADDRLDIADGGDSLDIVVLLNQCTWSAGSLTGKVNEPGTSHGDGLDSAQIFFVINSDRCIDTDNDGLFDGWESFGYDDNGDNTVDVDLPAMGANPKRRDLFLEIDFLFAATHSHAPLQAAVRQVVQAFANAPLVNVDGSTGVQLHVDVGQIYGTGNIVSVLGTGGVTGTFGDYKGGGDAIAEAGNAIVDWDGATGSPATNFFTLKNLAKNRNPIFRYTLFAHQTNFRAVSNDCTSGWAKGIPGVNFLVSLGGTSTAGGACWGVDGAGQSIGSQAQQAGTLMHEFGHTLGLGHGGNDPINNKPNYLSVMNYTFQACQVTTILPTVPGGCDYSRIQLPGPIGLNETSLDECLNVDNNALGLGPLNWDGDALIEGTTNCRPPNNANVRFNANGDFNDTNNNQTQDPGETPIFGVLNGFQDWNALVYNFRIGANYDTSGTPTTQEADPTTLARARALLAERVRPGLAIDKTGPADARPGDTLPYAIAIENSLQRGGRGPALNVVVTDTKPDATVQTFPIGMLVLGASANRTLSYTVPCTVKDGAIVTNTAHATALDQINNPVTATDSVVTAVHAPVLVMQIAAPATVNAGEAILYALTFQNTGSAAASNVVITDTIPADVYYSQALDQGTGPAPSSITVNSDGTRTLVWNVGAVPANSSPRTINFTARPTLLALGGTAFVDKATLTFQHGAACVGDTVSASASTSISVVPLVKENEPKGWLLWKLHVEKAERETLRRIQATDQRFDGGDGSKADGALVEAELKPAFKIGWFSSLFAGDHNKPKKLARELLALYFNLATRRLNADTLVNAKFHPLPGVTTVREAALHAAATLTLPYDGTTKARYHDAIEALEELNH